MERGLAGDPGLVVVCGEAGIGKTTLVEDLARVARGRHVRVVNGWADERDLSAFGLWRGPCRQLNLALGELDESLPPTERRWELLGDLTETLERAGPVLVLLEDIQWADELSLWALERLSVGLAGSPVALVASCRDDGAGPPLVASLRPAVVIRVFGLSAVEVAELSVHLGPGYGVDADDLCRRTGGNPLFVRELLTWRQGIGRVPPVVGNLLKKSFETLSKPTCRALAVSALAGSDTPPAVLAAAAGLSLGEFRGCLDEARQAGVLGVGPEGRDEFRHALLADAAIELLAVHEERQVHQALAENWGLMGPSPKSLARAAMSLVAAVPLVDARDAARTARRAAEAAMRANDPASAASLLRGAVGSLVAHASEEREMRAELLVELGDALSALGNAAGAEAAFDEAATMAAVYGDNRLRALAESGAARYVNVFADNSVRRRRLAEAERALAPGDDALRVSLLGRLAVVGVARGDQEVGSLRMAEKAVAMARRVDDPAVLATALIDRYLVSTDHPELEARRRDAGELTSLGERCQRTDLVLTGHQWLYSAMVARGDLAGARQTLDDYEVMASLMPSPAWRYGAMLRNAMLAVLDGDRQTALDLVEKGAPLGRAALPEGEAIGLEHGVRAITARLTGVPDPQLPRLHEDAVRVFGRIPAPFFQVHLAVSHLEVGNKGAATKTVARWVPDIAHIVPRAQAPAIISVLGGLVADLSMAEHARAVRDALEPFSGLYTAERGFAVEMPIDATLGRLALLEGDVDGAVHHLKIALDLACSMRSPVLEARCLWYLAQAQESAGATNASDEARRRALALANRVGVVLERPEAATPAPSVPAAATLTRSAGRWTIESPYGLAEVADSVGLTQLAKILAAAPREIASVELTGQEDMRPAADLGPLLDATAKRAYRRRLNELQSEIDDADDCADIERAGRARLELDALIAELRRAVGLGGRDRPNASGAERARVNVARTVRRAIASVSGVLPDLGAHLDVSVRTGRFCSYAPDPAAALAWVVTT
jgi:tetratricopeptide (TPR) repeat protein